MISERIVPIGSLRKATSARQRKALGVAMIFGRKHSDDAPDIAPAVAPEAFPAGAARVIALVTDTDRPLDNLHKLAVRNMMGAAATTRILFDAGAGPVTSTRDLWLDQDHWLTEGMEVPSMAERAAGAKKIESLQQQIGTVMSNPTTMPTLAVPSNPD